MEETVVACKRGQNQTQVPLSAFSEQEPGDNGVLGTWANVNPLG